MDTRNNPVILSEFSAVLLQDCDAFQPGEFVKRTGVDDLDSPTAASEPWGVTMWEPPSSRGARNMVGYWSGDADTLLWQSQGDGAWSTFDTGVSLVRGLHQFVQGRMTTQDNAGVTVFKTALFVASAAPEDSGTSFPFSQLVYRLDFDDPTSRISQSPDVYPRAILWWQGRMWAGNSAATEHGLSWLGWSSIFDGARGWTAFDQNIQVQPDDNDEITGLHPVRGTNNEIYIFKTRSVHALSVFWDTEGFYTESFNVLDTTQSQLRTISNGVGCVATKSILEVTVSDGSADLFFLAHDGVRSIRRAEQDVAAGAGRPISDSIQATIDRINFNFAYKATAILHKNLYLLAVPVDGSTENNLVLGYDLVTSSWFTYSWTVADWTDVELTTRERQIFFQNQQVFLNGSSVSGYHLYRGLSGALTDPGGSAIPFRIETKAYDHKDPLQLKRWDFLEIQGVVTGDSAVTLTVESNIDEAGFGGTKFIVLQSGGVTSPTLPFTLPFRASTGQAQIIATGMLDQVPGHRIEYRIDEQESTTTTVALRRITSGARPYPRQYTTT